MPKMISIICYATTDCNLDCTYCYTRAVYPANQKLSITKIRKLVENCSSGFDGVEFCWHGGEPMLVGKNFYEEVVHTEYEVNQKMGTKFINSIQSNCLLLSDDLISFFKSNSFRIGSTFEAPPEVHAKHRLSVHHKQIGVKAYMDVFERIKAAGLPLGLLCPITRENVGRAEEIFEFFRKIGAITYSLLPLIETPRPHRPETPTNEELYELFRKTFELRISKENSFASIEPIDTIIRSLLGEKPRLCTFASSCLKRMISVSPDGAVIPCGSLRDFPLGNVFDEPLVGILRNAKTRELRELRADSTRRYCNGCRYIAICRGGCRETAFWHSHKYGGPFPYCEARKAIFVYVEKRLREILYA